MDESDQRAVASARITRAFDGLLSAAMARLRLHYAVRIGALLIAARHDPSAALAALVNERDAALDGLQRHIDEARRQALHAVRRRTRRRHARVTIEISQSHASPARGRTGRLRQPIRSRLRAKDYSP